jgi:hypothetical protein
MLQAAPLGLFRFEAIPPSAQAIGFSGKTKGTSEDRGVAFPSACIDKLISLRLSGQDLKGYF